MGIGRQKNNCQDWSDKIRSTREDGVVWSARRNLSIDGTLLQTFLSTPNRDEYVSLTDYSYDELGRVGSVTHQDLYSDQVARELYSYQGFCKRVSVQDVEKISCHDGFGHNLRTIIPNEEAEIRYGVSGNIVEVENLGMKWGHDSNGNINSFTSNDHHINEMADYLNKGLKIVRSNGDVTEFDQFERAISFNNRVTRAIYRYDSRNGLLKSERTEGGLGILNKAYTHDVHNRVKSSKSNELDENYEYDNWGRVTRLQSGVANKFTSSVGYRYDAGLTSAVTPFVKRVKYNENSSPSLVEFENGLRVSIERDRYTDAITSLTYTHNNRLLWRMSFTLSRTNLESCSGQHRLDGKKVVGTLIRSTLGPLESQDFCYDQSQQLVSVDEVGDKTSDLNLSWSHDKLIEVEAVRNLYNAAGSLSLSCYNENCFTRHDLNTVTYKGLFLRLHEIQGLPVAVQINDQFFPVITDHLGTIRGLIAKDGASLLFERRFDPWGKKVAVYTNKVPASSIIENAVVWSFARLIHNPLLNNSASGTQLYWSQSRVYFASKREWLSFDPTIKWNPQVIAQNPGNWHPYKYASGDPVNYIDPSGHVWQEAAPFVMASTLGGAVAYQIGKSQGLSGWPLVNATAIGALSAAFSTLKIFSSIAYSSALAFSSNVATQFSGGASFKDLNLASGLLSAFSGGMGAYAGNLASRTFQLIGPNVVGQRMDAVMGFRNFSDSMISAGVGGAVGSSLEIVSSGFGSEFSDNNKLKINF